MSLNIPTLNAGNGFENPSFVESLGSACADWGFFQLVGHGIDPELRQRFFAAQKELFDLSEIEKLKLSRTEANFWGYYNKELTKNKVDAKEIFDIDGNLVNLHLPHPEFPVPWPEELPHCKSLAVEWLQQVENLSQHLLGSICLALGQSSATLNPFFLKDHTSFLRFNFYPSIIQRDSDENGLGIHPHTDAGALTVLAQDNVPGLEVKKEDTWHIVLPEENSLIINIGDMVQVWSNDRFRAPEHRVRASGESARYSAPYFYNPSYASVCSPLVDKPEERLYRPVSWREFRSGRAAGDYADQGEEIQISWYRI